MQRIKNHKSTIIIAIVLVGVLLLCAMLYFFPVTRHTAKVVSTRVIDSVEQRIPVLIYHHLLPNQSSSKANNSMVVDVDEFDRQMKVLYDNGYESITTDQLYQFIQGTITLPPKTVLITFDDGYESNYIYAYPILKKYGFRATVFIIGSNVRDYGEAFNPDVLQYISTSAIRNSSDVFEFGSHTYDLHRIGDDDKSVLVKCPEQEVEKDLEMSKKHMTTTSFAYPYGKYNKQIQKALNNTGFTMAFTTRPDRASRFSDVYAIPRYTIYRDTPIQVFKEIVGIYE